MFLSIGLAVAGMLLPTGCSTSPRGAADGDQAATTASPKSGTTSSRAGSPAPPKARVTSTSLPAGTALVVRTTSTMSTRTQQTGQSFTAHIEQPVLLNGLEVFPKGAMVEGTVVDSDEGGRVKGLAILAVRLTGLHRANGQLVNISTNSLAVEARSTKKKDALKVGIGSGVGAAIGAIAGGGKGAAIGAAAGAGAGTGVVLATHGDSAVIPSESVLRFTLSAAAVLPG